MNPIVGWVLAALAVALAWQKYGWQGAAFAGTLVVFWLLLQFNRSLRAMRNASESPVGHVDSAVMLNAKLQPRMSMLEIVKLTRSLGRRTGGSDGNDREPEVWTWADDGGSHVEVTFVGGRCTRWTLHRPETAYDGP